MVLFNHTNVSYKTLGNILYAELRCFHNPDLRQSDLKSKQDSSDSWVSPREF